MTAHEPRLRALMDGFLCALFALSIVTPLVAMIARGGSPTILVAESRRAAPRPERPHEWGPLVLYPALFQAWWNEVFGGREELVRGHNALDLFVLHTTPNPAYCLGDAAGFSGWATTRGAVGADCTSSELPSSKPGVRSWRCGAIG